MQRVGEHPVPAGPLAARWLGYELPTAPCRRAGDRAASARERGLGDVALPRARLVPLARRPRQRDRLGRPANATAARRAARRGGRGGRVRAGHEATRRVPPRVRPRRGVPVLVRRGRLARARPRGRRDAEDRRAPARGRRPRRRRRGHGGGARGAGGGARGRDAVATAHLVAGAVPEPDWSRRVLDAHAEGFAAVGGSIDDGRELAAWRSDGGRNPAFQHPLLLPSLLDGFELREHVGLPAYFPERVQNGEPWLFDGRIRLRLRRDRRRA